MFSTDSQPFLALLKIDFLLASPTPCWPLASVTPPPAPPQYTVEPAAVNPSCRSRLVACNPPTSHWLCLQTSMISSEWARPFLPLTARVWANSPSRVFNLAALRTARLTRRVFLPLPFRFSRSFQPSNLPPGLAAALLPTCRVQHSRPAMSASILPCLLLTHVGSPVVCTLRTTEPKLSAAKPHRCRRPGRLRKN